MSSFRQNSGGACGDVSLTVPLAPCGPAGPPGAPPGAGPAEVRFAGVDTKEKMYEPKQRKKLVRVLTVVAYLFFVSLAAAMLSLYYVFLWNPSHSRSSAKARQLSDEQLRLREQAARRELNSIQDQIRLNEQLRQQEQQGLLQQQRVAMELRQLELEQQQQAWLTTPPPEDPDGPDASPDYADFITERPEEDEQYTVEPRMLRHHGLVVPVGKGGGRGLDGPGDTGNAIPLVAVAAGHGLVQDRQDAHPRPSRSGSGHSALRHASLHGQRGLELG